MGDVGGSVFVLGNAGAAPRTKSQWFAAVVLSAALAACGGGGGGGEPVAEPQAAQATAAPAAACSFEHVYVTVRAVRVLEQLDGGERWVDIAPATPQRIDLLTVTGGLLQALGAAPLPPGHYTAVRLILVDEAGANQVQPTGGGMVPVETPGGAQAGLLINGDFVVPAGQLGDIALQGFDPCKSIVQAGSAKSPRY